MIKYFDFEKDIEKIEEAIISIDSDDKVNIEKLNELKSKRKKNFKKNLYIFECLAKGSSSKTY